MWACKTRLPSPAMLCVIQEENCSNSKLWCHLLRFIKITISVANDKRYFYFVWRGSVVDKSDLSSPSTTSVSCSVLFPLMKEGSEFGATAPDVVQISSSTSGLFFFFFFSPRS